jgi:ubiquinone/menaquinone biosynthesis C-methylase UbiE
VGDIRTEEWAGEVGARWLAHLDAFEATIEPIGRALLDHAEMKPGDRVADIGCGGGATTLDIARRVGPGGFATGIDIAPMLIEKARERLAAAELPNVDFLLADAQREAPKQTPFDALFSRFGLMFFDDSAAAFANLRSWLKPGGRLVFSCWAAPDRNAWIGLVGEVIARHGPMPEREPDAPGPFRFADPESTRKLLEQAGFDDLSIELWEGEQPFAGLGATPEQAAEFVIAAMSVAEPLRQAGADLARVEADLAEAMRPHLRDGAIRLGGAAWFVTARNPG